MGGVDIPFKEIPELPLKGGYRGNGVSPGFWIAVSEILIQAMYKKGTANNTNEAICLVYKTLLAFILLTTNT